MSGIAGKKGRLKVSTDGGTVFNVVLGIKSVTVEIDGGTVDDDEFGVDWKQRLQTLKDVKFSFQGSFRPGDATGQIAIRTALINDSSLWAEWLPDNGTTPNAGFKIAVVPTKFSVDPAVDGINAVSGELVGTGPLTLV